MKKRLPSLQSRWLLAASLTLIGVGIGLIGLGVAPRPTVGAPLYAENAPLYAENAPLSREEARRLYGKALEALRAQEAQAALQDFETLEPVYPGLRDLLYFHQAEAWSQIPDEGQTQRKLGALLALKPASPLQAAALYALGQSHSRANQSELAKAHFQKVQQDFPETPYAIGSFYYLSLLNPEPQQAAEACRQYLRQAPDGRFALACVQRLEALGLSLTTEDHRLMGLAYAGQNWAKALEHLRRAPQAWWPLGQAQLMTGETAIGRQTLIQGLPRAQEADVTRQAVDLLLKNTPAEMRLNTLQHLSRALPAAGGDYLLWKLAEVDATQASTYYQSILTRFPTGDYAPESSWRLLWPLIAQKRYGEYQSRATTHLNRYPRSKSAAKVLFWQGKAWEAQGQKGGAIQTYERLTRQYPNTYYAFRAERRLVALRQGQGDPGWTTGPDGMPTYPPAPVARDAFAFEGPLAALESPTRQQLQELQAIGATEDMALLLKGALSEVPPVVESWIALEEGNRAQSIRVLRDALEERFKRSGGVSTSTERRLLYPIHFADVIATQARHNRLNPYLVQALMREESYFNPYALSGSNARGLMQLLPGTAAEVAQWVGQKGFQPLDLFFPEVNVRLGTRYLAYLHGLFDGNAMLAVGAYNGGPNAMKRWLAQSPNWRQDPDLFVESIPYAEARDYIKKVFTSYWNYRQLYAAK